MTSRSGTTDRFDRFAALLALTSLGVTWPVLDLLGRNAAFFVARRSPTWEIIGLGLLLAIGIPLVAALLGSLPGLVGRALGFVLIAVTASSLALLYVRRIPIEWLPTTAVAAVIGLVVAWIFHSFDTPRMLARYLSPAPLVLFLLFLFATPAGAMASSGGAELGSSVQPDRLVPVVMVVFDELPAASLMDGDGNLRTDRYPGFARLAADGVWFRNAVTVEESTEHSVPAILTGVTPDHSLIPFASQYPNNLFTLLQDSHELTVYETITQLCPPAVCEGLGTSQTPLLRDVGVVAGHVLLPENLSSDLPQIDAGWGDFGAATTEFDLISEFRENFEADPRTPIRTILDDIRAPTAGEVPLYYVHALIPHHPWQFLADGRRYPLDEERAPGSDSPGWGPDEFLSQQAVQRHLIQVEYADTVLGQILDAANRAGIYDDAIILVVSDHGIAVKPEVEHQRRISENTIGEVAAIPLFVKAPGLSAGVVDDRRVHTTDILPTIADVLGITLPWETDGVSLLGPDPQRAESTTRGHDGDITYGGDGAEALDVAGRLDRWFPTGDPWDLVPPGAPDLVGEPIDVAALASGDGTVDIELRDIYTGVLQDGDVMPSRVTGLLQGDFDGSEILVVIVNDVVGAVTRTFVEQDRPQFQAMVHPAYFTKQNNSVDIAQLLPDGSLLLLEPRR